MAADPTPSAPRPDSVGTATGVTGTTRMDPPSQLRAFADHWQHSHNRVYCGDCQRTKTQGHAPDCLRLAALAGAEALARVAALEQARDEYRDLVLVSLARRTRRVELQEELVTAEDALSRTMTILNTAEARVAALEAQIKLACEECINMILADDWSADGAFARRVLVLLLAPRPTATEEPTPTPTATEGK